MSTTEFTCPQCAVPLPFVVPDAVVFGCPDCGCQRSLDEQGNWIARPGRPHAALFTKPDWMRPGAQVKYNNSTYTLYAVFSHSVNWTELDPESGAYDHGYSDDLEYYFINQNDDWFSLETADNNSFQVRKPIKVTPQMVERTKNEDTKHPNPEYGNYQLQGFWGTDDEPLQNEPWKYAVVRDGASSVSVEWKDGMPTDQWQASRLLKLGPLQLEKWKIRSPEEIAEAAENAKKQGFFRDVFGYGTLALLVLTIFSGIKGNTDLKLDASWNFSTPPSMEAFRNEVHQRELGVVHLEAKQPYRFSSRCNFGSQNADASFSLSVVRVSNGATVNNISADFFTETGVDSDGSWSESTLSDYFNFVAEQTGDYAIVARVRPNGQISTLPGFTQSGTLYVDIKPILMTRFFVIGMLLAALIWLIYQWRWEYHAMRADNKISVWLQSMFK